MGLTISVKHRFALPLPPNGLTNTLALREGVLSVLNGSSDMNTLGESVTYLDKRISCLCPSKPVLLEN